MPVPESKIYNDAPDEFAKFLDSGNYVVTLGELGGLGNPFVTEGIYKKRHLETPEGYGYTVCPKCGDLLDLYFLEEDDTITCENRQHGPWTFEVKEEDCTFYEIDHHALADFMSKGLGCRVCRQFKDGWLFGKLRGYDVYFACTPTEGMYRALESTPKSVLVIGQNTPKSLPPELATRVIYLSRLLYVKDGTLHFANEAVEDKIPLPRGGAHSESGSKEKLVKKPPKRWPIQVYAPFYLSMMAEWLDILRKEDRVGQPTKEWMVDWLYKHGASPNRKRLSTRQIYRHIDVMTTELPPSKGKRDLRVPVFGISWNGCEDKAYVATYSVDDITTAIMNAYDNAKKMGFDVKPMKNMDAADFADKSDGKFGQKRNFRTHVD